MQNKYATTTMQFTEHRIEAKFTTRVPKSIIRAVLNGAVKTVKI